MRRSIVVVTLLTGALAAVLVTTAMPAASASAGERPAAPHARPATGPISAGSVWTLYDEDYTSGITSCAVLNFSVSQAFSDDHDGFGHWNAHGRLEWAADGYLVNDAVYKGRYNSTSKQFVGTVTARGGTWGEFVMVKNDDPLGAGHC